MIKVLKESESYNSKEFKFDSLKDVYTYLNDDSVVDKWEDDNKEIYIRSLNRNKDNSYYSILIGLSDYMSALPEVTVSFYKDNSVYGPEHFDDYYQAVDWIKNEISHYM